MRYDVGNLQPLYQLEIGKPGSSFALEIAQKIGLPKPTIEKAKKRVGKKLVSYDRMLADLGAQRQLVEQSKKSLLKREEDLEDLTNQYQQLKSHLEQREKKILNEAKKKANQIIKNANKEVERAIREIKEKQAVKEVVKAQREKLEKLKTKEEKMPIKKSTEPLKEGDYAQVGGQSTIGVIVQIKGKDAQLKMGELTSFVKLNRLVKVNRRVFKNQGDVVRQKMVDVTKKMADFEHKLDIRGRRAEEVIPILDKWIDEALLLGINELQVLHGTGSGVLRQVTRNFLFTLKSVKSFKDEHVERGGSGITLIQMK